MLSKRLSSSAHSPSSSKPLPSSAKMTKRALTSRASQGGSSSAAQQQQREMGNGFKTLQMGDTRHVCYMRAHNGDDERTMFLVNLPVDTTERHVRALFADAGVIESVRLWRSRAVDDDEDADDDTSAGATIATGKDKATSIIALPALDPRSPNEFLPTATNAHVTFLDEVSLGRALKTAHVKSWPNPYQSLAETEARLKNDTGGKKRRARTAEEAAVLALATEGNQVPPVGLAFLLARQDTMRPPLDAVRAHADSVIAEFEWRLKHPRLDKKNKPAIEAVSVGPNGELLDADGFTIVQATGKYGRTADGQGGSMRVARSRSQGGGRARGGADDDDDESQGPSKKKKRLELDDFYRFQRREAKRQELADLRSKFQADQEKIKKLKTSRNFKPF